MITRASKNAVIKDLKEKITTSNGLFLTNVVGMEANDVVKLRKTIRESKGSLVVTRNTLFEKAAEGTYAENLLKGLKGTNAVAFAFDDAPAIAKALLETSKEIELVTLGKGFLSEEPLDESQVIVLAKLPTRDEMLGTLLATFNAPISALARVMYSIKEELEIQGVEKAADLKATDAVEQEA